MVSFLAKKYYRGKKISEVNKNLYRAGSRQIVYMDYQIKPQ